MAIILDGKAAAAALRLELAEEVARLKEEQGRAPGLTVILVGEDPASSVYVRNKERQAAECGFVSTAHRLPATASQHELEELIDRLNEDDGVDGILLQLPLPKPLKSQPLLERILPSKDVDGFHPENMGRLTLGLTGLRPCTPAGVMALLHRYEIDVGGKRAVVIGRSNIVGKPMALLLLHANATPTICHSRTPDLAAVCREADVLVSAIGVPGFVTADMVKEGAVVVDVGINRVERDGVARLVGDVDFANVSPKCHAITPVPGGVGPMTIAGLMANTVTAFKMRLGI